jgi:hypothetical protein
MPIIMMQICDRCGHSQDRSSEGVRDMFEVAVTCEAVDQFRNQYYTPFKRQLVIWCQPCVDEVGVQRPIILRGASDVLPPSIEDLLREMVRNVVQEEKESD